MSVCVVIIQSYLNLVSGVARALYSYQGQSAEELSFQEGALIHLMRCRHGEVCVMRTNSRANFMSFTCFCFFHLCNINHFAPTDLSQQISLNVFVCLSGG